MTEDELRKKVRGILSRTWGTTEEQVATYQFTQKCLDDLERQILALCSDYYRKQERERIIEKLKLHLVHEWVIDWVRLKTT